MSGTGPSRPPRTNDVSSYPHEKENILSVESDIQEVQASKPSIASRIVPTRTGYSRPLLADTYQRQILPGPSRAGRIMKSIGFGLGLTKSIPESHATGIEDLPSDYETDPGENDPPAPSTTPFPSTDDLQSLVNNGDTEVIEPASIPSSSNQRSYAGPPNSTSSREAAPVKEPALSMSTGTRPRRSASLSDALNLHDAGYGYQYQQQQQQLREQYQGLRSASNGNDNTGGPRRVTLEEREREEREMRAEYKKYRREAEEADRRQAEQDQYYDQQQQPYLNPQPTNRPTHGHKRRDSDTLRSVPPSLGSPTVIDIPPPRTSPPISSRAGQVSPGLSSSSSRRLSLNSNSRLGRVSPPAAAGGGRRIGRTSPPGSRVSPNPVPPVPVKHRPTAPEHGTMREEAREGELEYGGGGDERERDGKRHIQVPPASAPAAVSASAPPQGQASQPAQLNRHMVVNKKPYARLDMIGKGGSSRVFRVLNHANELYAIKRVSLDKTEADTMSGYMNEIALLKRLEGNSRIIRLYDSEVKAGPGGSKGHLLLVMECGEVDLSRLISERAGEPLNMIWVAYYWQQMLQAVHVIHEEKIVHSDLKPANFVLVRGQLKLIDFGIANAIANDTTNIQRDHQVGTVNYMSPEAIELPDGMRRLKVGRPSDVWSLGCILYQMVYGQPPFQHLSMYQKMKAIPDGSHVIEFPEYSTPLAPVPRTNNGGGGSAGGSGTMTPPKRLEHLKVRVRRDVVASMKSCLARGPKDRMTIPELLDQDWLAMKEPEPPAVKELLAPDETVINPYYMRQLLQYGIKLGEAQSSDMSPEALLREAERLVAELKSIQP